MTQILIQGCSTYAANCGHFDLMRVLNFSEIAAGDYIVKLKCWVYCYKNGYRIKITSASKSKNSHGLCSSVHKHIMCWMFKFNYFVTHSQHSFLFFVHMQTQPNNSVLTDEKETGYFFFFFKSAPVTEEMMSKQQIIRRRGKNKHRKKKKSLWKTSSIRENYSTGRTARAEQQGSERCR